MRIGHYRLYDEAGVIFTKMMTERIAGEALKMYSRGLAGFEDDEDEEASSSLYTSFSKRLQCLIFLKDLWEEDPSLVLPMNRYTWTEHARRNLVAKARGLAGVRPSKVSALFLGISKETTAVDSPPSSSSSSSLSSSWILGQSSLAMAREERQAYLESHSSAGAWMDDSEIFKRVRALFPKADLALAKEGLEGAIGEKGAERSGTKRKRDECQDVKDEESQKKAKVNDDTAAAAEAAAACPEALREARERAMAAHDEHIRKALLDALDERHHSWRVMPKEKRGPRVRLTIEEIESLRLDRLAFLLAQSAHHSSMTPANKVAVLEVLCEYLWCQREEAREVERGGGGGGGGREEGGRTKDGVVQPG